MTVGIIGLGLIGGSFAKAYKAAGHTVLAYDADRSILDFAILSGAVDAELTQGGGKFSGDAELTQGGALSVGTHVGDASQRRPDLLLIALYPRAAVEYLEVEARRIHPETFVIDCCGTKKNICEAGFRAAAEYGFTFVGGHPMAGTERSGFKHSKANMFKGASMIVVPPVYDDILFLDKVKELLAPAGFGRLTVTTAEKHDAMIAFTSQLAHLVSNAYIKSPTVFRHKGFSAGSYKDLTRVAWLNELMWAELFIENKMNLLSELNTLIVSLNAYRDALRDEDFTTLKDLLYDGKRLKEEVDSR